MNVHHPLDARGKAVALGALCYTVLQSLGAFGALTAGLEALVPGSGPQFDTSIRVASAFLQAGSLVGFVTLAERAVLSWRTRRLRGEWIYLSSSGNWGHVRIYLQKTRVRYKVDLYESKADLVSALTHKRANRRIGTGHDLITVVTEDNVYSWYHVPPSGKYRRREGILTLSPALDGQSYSARWERIGVLGQSLASAGEAGAAPLDPNDHQHSAGHFEFFVRKAVFNRDKDAYGT